MQYGLNFVTADFKNGYEMLGSTTWNLKILQDYFVFIWQQPKNIAGEWRQIKKQNDRNSLIY